MKKILALLLALVMVIGLVACGNTNTPSTPSTPSNPSTPGSQAPSSQAPEAPKYEDMGTIMWLAHLSSGAGYDAFVNYMTACCEALGYEFLVVYADPMNDAAGNLLQVQNNMTDDVVGLLASQDGGLQAIMEEYPELWVVGFNADLRSAFDEGGANHGVMEMDHFLGAIYDGYEKGYQTGKDYANFVIEKGYKKISILDFPAFAYPSKLENYEAFMEVINEYNKTASEPIQIIGEKTTLMFSPLQDSWFLEEGRDDLDAIVAFLAGQQFVYPTMISAIANGTCSPDTKLITGGLESDPDLVADVGEDKTVVRLQVTPVENPAFCLILIDNAITGNLPADFKVMPVAGAPYIVDSAEDMQNVMTKSMYGTGNPELAHLTVDEIVALCGRNNPDLTFAELVEIFQSISVDELK